MTNLNILYTYYNVQTHKAQKALEDLLKNHLPNGYTSIVIDKLKEDGIIVKAGTVRNVKAGSCKNLIVFNAIVEVAASRKLVSENLKTTLDQTG